MLKKRKETRFQQKSITNQKLGIENYKDGETTIGSNTHRSVEGKALRLSTMRVSLTLSPTE